MSVSNGIFITLEGIEGSGKTTQHQKLSAHLEKTGRQIVSTREPGGTGIGKVLREMILSPETKFQCDKTEILLFFADRMEHVETVVKPALEEGKVVICDRYFDSTVAYQIGGRDMPADFIHALQTHINLVPDLTLLFDISPEEGLRRAINRADLDRFEQEEMDFHHRVRNTYLGIADKEPNRVRKIEVGTLSVDDVFDKVLALIEDKIPALS